MTCGTLSAQQKGATPLSPAHPLTLSPAGTRVVVVGISDYQDPAIPDLRFADRDAEAFANFLRSPAGGSLDGDHLKILTNEKATMGKVAAALDWLLDVCKEGDRAIIYFSGHGDVERKTISQPGYLLCWDAPPQIYMSGGAFNLRDLEEVVSTLSIQNKVHAIVIADACHAGKLSGAGIGGAQITGASLARQYANEIKILSCQPHEYSIEGEQWGGGRGAFSYHLLDGLLGLADRNADTSVTLSEIDRYLEDHVTPEVAPQRQTPLVLGNKTEHLAAVFPEILAELKKGKTGQLAVFSRIDSRGLEDDVLAGVDTTIRQVYRLFKKALDDKTFFEPVGACADVFYDKLIAEPKLERLHHTMRRNYAAALQDDAQQAVNNLMKAEKTEVRLYRLERVKKYGPYPRYLARAAELLGPKHYLYATLQGRKCYYEGTLLQLESPLNPDTLLGRRLLDKYRESLDWQPDAPLTYLAMSEVFTRILRNTDSIYWYGHKAIEAAPNLISAYTLTAARLFWPKMTHYAQPLLDQAMALDSTRAAIWIAYGNWHYFRGNKDVSESYFRKAAALDSTYTEPYYRLGILYFDRGKMQESRQYFLKAAQSDKPQPSTFDYLACIHFNVGEYVEAEKYFLQGLAIEPYYALLLIHYASNCWKANRPEEAKALLLKAMAYDSTSFQTLLNIGQAFYYNRFYPEAETVLQKGLALDSTDAYSWVLLGQLYRATQREEAAIKAVERGVRLDSTFASDWSILASMYLNAGRTADAEWAFKKIISLDSSSVYNWLNLGGLYQGTGREAEAEQIYKNCLQRDSSNVYAWLSLGGLYRTTNREAEAEQVFKNCLQRDSSNANIWLNLGGLYEATGRAAEATRMYASILERDSSLQMHYSLGTSFLINHRYEEAESVYQKILQRDPGNKTANYNLACICGTQNRVYDAFAFLEQALKNGWDNYNWAQKDTDLASLRERTEQWKALMKKYFPDQEKD
ncbi:MAG: tetratricopeptide repeat protein [Saprospiraceae bacterium]